VGSSRKKYFSIGLNHRNSEIQLREALSFSEEDLQVALHELIGEANVHEAVILSTCNRTEIFTYSDDGRAVQDWLVRKKNLDNKDAESLYTFEEDECVQHLFRIASGLDSMVLGETQIFGQLKKALDVAERGGASGKVLRRLFDESFRVAKKVRANTEIGAHSVSMPAASVRVAERIFGSLADLKVLFIGAGDMNNYCAEYYAGNNNSQLYFVNRTRLRADKLAAQFKGQSFEFENLFDRLAEFDVVISCTASSALILSENEIKKTLATRKQKPVLLIDLALPRDIDPSVSSLSNVFLYTIDDLGAVINLGQRNRSIAADTAEVMVREAMFEFRGEDRRLRLSKLIREVRQYGQNIQEVELRNALRQLKNGDDPEKVVRALARAMSNKFMHRPSEMLRREGQINIDSPESFVRQLFKGD
jgi:glutamyl-tRNA reductase